MSHFCFVFQNVFLKKLNESLLSGSPFTHMHVYKALGGMDNFWSKRTASRQKRLEMAGLADSMDSCGLGGPWVTAVSNLGGGGGGRDPGESWGFPMPPVRRNTPCEGWDELGWPSHGSEWEVLCHEARCQPGFGAHC